jgi:hypothetical protein
LPNKYGHSQESQEGMVLENTNKIVKNIIFENPNNLWVKDDKVFMKLNILKS